ncbi:alpha/beta hydrolase [Vagococcus lutrae]|uniref:alpha/beta hydrolase n=1 Tax=Vagococcus lutrae TaxID=81947 RepID=UPI0019278F98|nr:alpha/beta hydrolase [Vagococcus lutrae]
MYKKIIILMIVGGVMWAFFSPRPISWVIKQLFKGGVATSSPNEAQVFAKVQTINDQSYGKSQAKQYYDVVMPIKTSQSMPCIVWVHGGAYVGGDKEDVTAYAKHLASFGYMVISMNYSLAPKAQYPTPLFELDDLLTELKENRHDLPIDFNQLILAGDSAGAQIVSEYMRYVISDNLFGQTPSITKQQIKSLLLFCGPYDIEPFVTTSTGVFRWLVHRLMAAYFGPARSVNETVYQDVSLLQQDVSEFPPCFVTDGNDQSFEDQAKRLVTRLEQAKVPVTGVFYSRTTAILPHEYQFMLDKPEARQTLEELQAFLNDHTLR